jgi:hypothetical protein
MLQKDGTMLTPVEEQAVALYAAGKNLREVATEMRRSHEWVRKTVKKAGEDTRRRGREARERPMCGECKQECNKPNAQFCSRICLNMFRHREAVGKLQKALHVLRGGGTYSEAAAAVGFPNGWHLWGRLHHFGLTAGLTAPTKKSVSLRG